MSIAAETTIRVPVGLRDHIRTQAAAHGLNQAEFLHLALRELEQAEFLRSVAETDWDDDADTRAWDDADLSTALDPWEPAR